MTPVPGVHSALGGLGLGPKWPVDQNVTLIFAKIFILNYFIDVVSPNEAKEEDSTPEPVTHDIQRGSDERFPTKSTEEVLFHGIVPRRGLSRKNKTDHTGIK